MVALRSDNTTNWATRHKVLLPIYFDEKSRRETKFEEYYPPSFERFGE